jgi:uncharacterized protein YydD (DUF2326 family)
MIHSVTANKPGFKSVKFQKGLNLILSERSENSSEKDSRNGSGKSLLIEIIDFCLGASFIKGSKLFDSKLKDWSFSVEMDILKNQFVVTRSTNNPKNIAWQIKTVKKGKPISFENPATLESWNSFLGKAFFKLEGTEPNLSYRTLMKFLIRRA